MASKENKVKKIEQGGRDGNLARYVQRGCGGGKGEGAAKGKVRNSERDSKTDNRRSFQHRTVTTTRHPAGERVAEAVAARGAEGETMQEAKVTGRWVRRWPSECGGRAASSMSMAKPEVSGATRDRGTRAGASAQAGLRRARAAARCACDAVRGGAKSDSGASACDARMDDGRETRGDCARGWAQRRTTSAPARACAGSGTGGRGSGRDLLLLLGGTAPADSGA